MFERVETAFKKLSPSELCAQLRLRFELRSALYTDDSKLLYDRLNDADAWVDFWRAGELAQHPYGGYTLDDRSFIPFGHVSTIIAPKSFCFHGRPISALEIDIASNVESSLDDGKRRLQTHLDRMSPIDFEHFVAEILSNRGFKTMVTPASNDNGVDVFAVLYGKNTLGEVTIVQCKMTELPVGVAVVRELAGALLLHGSEKAMLVTSGRFTSKAEEVIENSPYHMIELVDFFKFRKWWLGVQGY